MLKYVPPVLILAFLALVIVLPLSSASSTVSTLACDCDAAWVENSGPGLCSPPSGVTVDFDSAVDGDCCTPTSCEWWIDVDYDSTQDEMWVTVESGGPGNWSEIYKTPAGEGPVRYWTATCGSESYRIRVWNGKPPSLGTGCVCAQYLVQCHSC